MDLEDKLTIYGEKALSEKRQQLALLAGRLDGVSPLKRLAAGYAYVADRDNRQIDSVDKVQKGDKLQIYLKNGRIMATVDKTEIIDR